MLIKKITTFFTLFFICASSFTQPLNKQPSANYSATNYTSVTVPNSNINSSNKFSAKKNWTEVSSVNGTSLYIDESSFEETQTQDRISAVMINYKTSTNPDYVGVAFTSKIYCNKGFGPAVLGHYNKPAEILNANTRIFDKGEFVVVKDIAFNFNKITHPMDQVFSKMCSLIPSLPKLMEQVQSGYIPAQVQLASLYWFGKTYDNTPFDIDEKNGFLLYEKAANLGNPESQEMLGDIYHNGWYKPKDKVLSAKWYEKAAIQGKVSAKAKLSNLYLNAIGVEKNKEKSDLLRKEVNDSNDPYAIELLDKENISDWKILFGIVFIILIFSLLLKSKISNFILGTIRIFLSFIWGAITELFH